MNIYSFDRGVKLLVLPLILLFILSFTTSFISAKLTNGVITVNGVGGGNVTNYYNQTFINQTTNITNNITTPEILWNANYTDFLNKVSWADINNDTIWDSWNIGNWTNDKQAYYTNGQVDDQIDIVWLNINNGTIITSESLWNANYSDFLNKVNWIDVLNGTLALNSDLFNGSYFNVPETDPLAYNGTLVSWLGLMNGTMVNSSILNNGTYFNTDTWVANYSSYYTKTDINNFNTSYLNTTNNTYQLWAYNQTIPALTYADSLLITTFFNASAVNAVTGTPQGTLANIQTYNGIAYNVTEVSSDIDLRVNFSGVDTFNQIVIRYKSDTTESHTLEVFIWDYTTSTWESYLNIGNTIGYVITTATVYDGASKHISGGVAQVRFLSTNVGGSTHKYEFDWVTISKGVATPSSSETDPHSIHSDGNIPLSANWGQGAFNLTDTDSWFLGKVDYTTINGVPAFALLTTLNNETYANTNLVNWLNVNNGTITDPNKVFWANVNNGTIVAAADANKVSWLNANNGTIFPTDKVSWLNVNNGTITAAADANKVSWLNANNGTITDVNKVFWANVNNGTITDVNKVFWSAVNNGTITDVNKVFWANVNNGTISDPNKISWSGINNNTLALISNLTNLVSWSTVNNGTITDPNKVFWLNVNNGTIFPTNKVSWADINNGTVTAPADANKVSWLNVNNGTITDVNKVFWLNVNNGTITGNANTVLWGAVNNGTIGPNHVSWADINNATVGINKVSWANINNGTSMNNTWVSWLGVSNGTMMVNNSVNMTISNVSFITNVTDTIIRIPIGNNLFFTDDTDPFIYFNQTDYVVIKSLFVNHNLIWGTRNLTMPYTMVTNNTFVQNASLPQITKTPANLSTTVITVYNTTILLAPVTLNRNYTVDCTLWTFTSSTAVGVQYNLSFPANSIKVLNGAWMQPQTLVATNYTNCVNSLNNWCAGNPTAGLVGGLPAYYNGYVEVNESGNMNISMKAEAAGTVTTGKGSYCILTDVAGVT